MSDLNSTTPRYPGIDQHPAELAFEVSWHPFDVRRGVWRNRALPTRVDRGFSIPAPVRPAAQECDAREVDGCTAAGDNSLALPILTFLYRILIIGVLPDGDVLS